MLQLSEGTAHAQGPRRQQITLTLHQPWKTHQRCRAVRNLTPQSPAHRYGVQSTHVTCIALRNTRCATHTHIIPCHTRHVHAQHPHKNGHVGVRAHAQADTRSTYQHTHMQAQRTQTCTRTHHQTVHEQYHGPGPGRCLWGAGCRMEAAHPHAALPIILVALACRPGGAPRVGAQPLGRHRAHTFLQHSAGAGEGAHDAVDAKDVPIVRYDGVVLHLPRDPAQAYGKAPVLSGNSRVVTSTTTTATITAATTRKRWKYNSLCIRHERLNTVEQLHTPQQRTWRKEYGGWRHLHAGQPAQQGMPRRRSAPCPLVTLATGTRTRLEGAWSGCRRRLIRRAGRRL